MTTHNTHHEHSDVDASLVEHPSDPENEISVNSAASETETSDASNIDAGSASVEQPSDAEQLPEVSAEDSAEAVAHASTPDAGTATEVISDTSAETHSAETVVSADALETAEIQSSAEQFKPTERSSNNEDIHSDNAPSEETTPITADVSAAEETYTPDNTTWSEPSVTAELQQENQEAAAASVDTEDQSTEIPAPQLEQTEIPVTETIDESFVAEQPVQTTETIYDNQTQVAAELQTEQVEEQMTAFAEQIDANTESVQPQETFALQEEPISTDTATGQDGSAEEVLPASATELTEQASENPAAVEDTTTPEQQQITFPYTDVAPLIETKVEEVRPFTEFIAEFRQAEAALQATLRDSQAEAFSLLSSVVNQMNDQEQAKGTEEATMSTVVADEQPATSSDEEEQSISQPPSDEKQMQDKEEITVHTEVSEKEEKKAIERPVSPLLRPASRVRMPRHSMTRHHRGETAATDANAETAEQKNQAALVENKEQAAPSVPAEPVAEAAPAKPARRYRFDRPSSSSNSSKNGASSTTSTPASTTNKTQTTTTRTETVQRGEQPGTGTSPVVATETQVQKQVAQEVENPAPAATTEHGRRRHHKEPSAPSTTTQQATPVMETAPAQEAIVQQQEEIAPEDLPPLEYSELQKASSRRRRRHRSSSSSSSASAVSNTQTTNSTPVPPVIPPTPVPTPTPPPPARVASAASTQPYSIVSGYTVSQMNQGNEASGPFMAPEPSPARGSVLMRDGRTTRAEARIAPATIYSPTPANRSGENGFSTAAMTQFANIVSQALQTQTDRMVTEFRRLSQAPTNVSVTLPPFPSTERVGVFVDVANLLYSARTLRVGVDFGKLLDFLRGNRRLIRAQAYCPTSPQPGDEQMFLQAVKGLGYRITTKNYKTFSSGAKKADLDLDLCMDVVRLVDGKAVDCIVLVSGDSDFMPMLDYCSDHGVRVEVAAFDEAMSATLRQSCDLFVNLSMLEEIRG
ncbi:MAG TPA: NYN domain-containing protein [Dictyobacter sp.]|nr:NYN domain-containing protein [Dictyobacter sp.]